MNIEGLQGVFGYLFLEMLNVLRLSLRDWSASTTSPDVAKSFSNFPLKNSFVLVLHSLWSMSLNTLPITLDSTSLIDAPHLLRWPFEGFQQLLIIVNIFTYSLMFKSASLTKLRNSLLTKVRWPSSRIFKASGRWLLSVSFSLMRKSSSLSIWLLLWSVVFRFPFFSDKVSFLNFIIWQRAAPDIRYRATSSSGVISC